MEAGQVIDGKYRLVRLLGDGGMGAVYEAHHEVLGARVAIKVLHEELTAKPEIVDRFLREARVLAQLTSPHVVRVLDIAMPEAGRSAYIVMELLSGEPLAALLTRERRLPLAVAVDYVGQILDALTAAHALGVVHRDLKPENVFVTRSGDRVILKLIDFGIAKAGLLAGAGANLTITGALMGTPEYMAPEQAHSAERADARADLYAAGVMLYEMLAGVRPVEGDDPRVVALKVERGEVPPLIRRAPDVPPELAGLVHRAMAPRPDLRFASAAEMKQALESAMAGARPRSGRPPASAATPEGNADGTLLGAPADLPPAPSRRSGAPTDPGGPPPFDARDAPSGAPPWVAPGGTQGRPRSVAPRPVQAKGRGRGGGAVLWGLGALGLLLVGGFVVAFLLQGSNGGGNGRRAEGPTATDTAPTPSASEAPHEVALDPSLGPLPVATNVPNTHAVAPPRPSSGPIPSASGAVPAPSASQALPTGPLGLPPFALPSGFPNPFPLPGASGMPPVFTLPTSFPPFGFPPEPAPTTPTPPSSAPPRHSGK